MNQIQRRILRTHFYNSSVIWKIWETQLLFLAVLFDDVFNAVHNNNGTVEIPNFAVVMFVGDFADILDGENALFIVNHRPDDLILDLQKLPRAASVESMNRRVTENPENRRIKDTEQKHLRHSNYAAPI